MRWVRSATKSISPSATMLMEVKRFGPRTERKREHRSWSFFRGRSLQGEPIKTFSMLVRDLDIFTPAVLSIEQMVPLPVPTWYLQEATRTKLPGKSWGLGEEPFSLHSAHCGLQMALRRSK